MWTLLTAGPVFPPSWSRNRPGPFPGPGSAPPFSSSPPLPWTPRHRLSPGATRRASTDGPSLWGPQASAWRPRQLPVLGSTGAQRLACRRAPRRRGQRAAAAERKSLAKDDTAAPGGRPRGRPLEAECGTSPLWPRLCLPCSGGCVHTLGSWPQTSML